MLIIIILIIVGFGIGSVAGSKIFIMESKYLALIFLGLLDSFTYGLSRDISGLKGSNGAIVIRLLTGLLVCGFIIYFGEKSEIDLYIVALIPLVVGFALNMYKFLPK